MFQLTRKADYGIRLMVEVAGRSGASTVTKEIAARQDIPYQFLRKVAQTLVTKGLLSSARGAKGGLSLARPAESITALDIVAAFDLPYLNRCISDPTQCPRRDVCAVYPVWVEAQKAVEQVLGGVRLSDMVRRQEILIGNGLVALSSHGHMGHRKRATKHM
jgi:Rrf2 family protein